MDLSIPLAATARPATANDGFEMVATTAPAQVIEYARGHHAALAPCAAVELLDQPRTAEVPGAAYYCQHLLQWRDAWLPLLNLRVLLTGYREAYLMSSRYALVVAWQSSARAPLSYGALALPFLPRVVEAQDADQCPLPTDSDLWPLLALSCFQHEGKAVPIIEVGTLFRGFLG